MPSILVLLALLVAALVVVGLWFNEWRRWKKETPPEITAPETSKGEGGEEHRSLIKKLKAAPGRIRAICGLIRHPERAKDEKGFLRLLPFFLVEKRQILKSLVLIGITSFFTLMFGVFARALPHAVEGNAMQRALPHAVEGNSVQLALLASIAIAVSGLGVLSTLLGQQILTHWSGNVVADINDAATQSALDARYEVHLQPETAEVVNGSQATLRQDLMAALNYGAFTILSGLVGLIAAVVACLITSWSITSVIFVLLALCAWNILRSSKARSKFFDERRKVLGEESVALEAAYSIPGIQDRKVGGKDFSQPLSDYTRRWRKLSVELTSRFQRASVPINIVTASVSPIIFLLMALMEMVGMVGKVSLGDILAMLTQIGILASTITQITYGLQWMQDLRDASKGFAEILGLEPDLAPSDDAVLTPADPHNRTLRLDGVWFTYPGKKRPIIRGASCEFGPGDFVSVIGGSGDGKSTLAQIVAGLLHPQQGQVWCGDHYIHALQKEVRQALVGFMGQKAPAFRGTVRQVFLDRWPEVKDDEIKQVLSLTTLYSELQGMEGLETLASNLSEGQRQRIQFSLLDYEFLRDGPKTLITDEGTSGLDLRSEMSIVKREQEMAEAGSTVIQVAHRVAAINAANKVLELENGKATLRTMEEARQNEESLYHRLVVATGATDETKIE